MLEIFAGSARLSQCCALHGMRVGTPIDIRNGFDLSTSKGRQMVSKIVKEQEPDVIILEPVCGPWSPMQNINDQDAVREKQSQAMPTWMGCGFASGLSCLDILGKGMVSICYSYASHVLKGS